MKTGTKAVIIAVAGIVAAAGLGVAGLASYMGRPTEGPKIPKMADGRTAVLVVDIQEDFTGPKAKKKYRDGDRIVAAASALVSMAEARGASVAFIENVVESLMLRRMMGDICAPGAAGTATDRRIPKPEDSKTFTKSRGDAFSNPALDLWLRANRVNHLVIVGLDAAYCVNSTVKGAVNRGYRVTVVLEGIATESSREIASIAAEWRKAGVEIRNSIDW